MTNRELDPRTLGRATVLLVGSPGAPASGPLEVVCARDGWDLRIDRARSACDAIRSLRSRGADLVVIDLDGMGHRARWMAHAARIAQPSAAIVVVGQWPSSDATRACLRAGVSEWIDADSWIVTDSLVNRLGALLARAVTDRLGVDRIAVLESACRRLSEERSQLQRKLGGASANLAGAEDIARDREGLAAMQAECRTLLSQEAEPELIVEIAANYLVSRLGPTNAALLVAEGESFRLAAYVRDDLTRRAAGKVLDQLSSSWATRIAAASSPIVLQEGSAPREGCEGLAAVLPGRSILAFSCNGAQSTRSRGVVVLFRDSQRPYGDGDIRVARAVGAALGYALDRTDRILNRATPKWPTEAPECPES